MSSLKSDTGVLRRLITGLGRRPSWRTLEQLADSPEFGQHIESAHPSLTPMLAGSGRRRVLQVMAASFAFGGLTACDRREPGSGTSELVPYVNQPAGLTPSQPQSYASAHLLEGIANGVLVTAVDGRPIKIEGNADHPFSRGGTDIFAQASVLTLYDPDRSQAVQHLSSLTDWDTFRAAMLNRFAALRAAGGSGLRLLTGPVSSPTLLAQIDGLRKAMPRMHWHAHAPAGRDALYAGARQAFGQPLETRWNFDKAELIVSLDGDFLDPGPQQIGSSRGWIEARRKQVARNKLLTMHALAPAPTLTAAKADFHHPIAGRDLPRVAEALLADLNNNGRATPGPLAEWRAGIVAALNNARGRSIVLTGTHQPPELHAAVHRINAALGNIDNTVSYTDPVLGQAEPVADLLAAMRAGEVTALVMLDTNPVYTVPDETAFGDLLSKVDLKLHAGLYRDETAVRCDWHLPLSHPLEAWGDARALDGTATIIQPTINPLYDSRSAPEILSILFDPQPAPGLRLIKDHWRGQDRNTDFEPAWRQALLGGFVPNSAFPAQRVQPAQAPPVQPSPAAGGPELLFRPDPTIWDGTYANNGWLQELPKPILQTLWENVISISPAFAARQKLKDGDIVGIEAANRTISGPVRVAPGQNDQTVVVYLGYGRNNAGSVGNGVGYNAYAIRRLETPWRIDGVRLHRIDGGHTVATTQQLDRQDGHDYVRLQRIGAKPVGDDQAFTQPTLFNRNESDGRAWGMVIDLDNCIGCNACVVACQSENNSPVVGREQILAGRDMHWLRVDRYYSGSDDDPDAHFMPVPCMHCENAPCELGCPVEATLHDNEGLNLMVYNRCIGTRACQAYCPYKVRHFNYLHYSDAPAVAQERNNPNVTVRARGVMEKCTYCVQRILAGRVAADKEHRAIRDGEVVTACAAACPTQAITFGDLGDKDSAVARARHDGRNYALLGELNTRPRTTYLAAFAPNGEKA